MIVSGQLSGRRTRRARTNAPEGDVRGVSTPAGRVWWKRGKGLRGAGSSPHYAVGLRSTRTWRGSEPIRPATRFVVSQLASSMRMAVMRIGRGSERELVVYGSGAGT